MLNILENLFIETELKFEVIVLSKINPIDLEIVLESVRKTGILFVVEEGSATGGIGSEIIATVCENIENKIITKRIASLPVPIPSVKSLENKVLSTEETVFNQILNSIKEK